MIQIFKRERSPYVDAYFNLREIDENKNYLFEDIDGGSFKISGKELVSNGLNIKIREQRVAKIFTYKEI